MNDSSAHHEGQTARTIPDEVVRRRPVRADRHDAGSAPPPLAWHLFRRTHRPALTTTSDPAISPRSRARTVVGRRPRGRVARGYRERHGITDMWEARERARSADRRRARSRSSAVRASSARPVRSRCPVRGGEGLAEGRHDQTHHKLLGTSVGKYHRSSVRTSRRRSPTSRGELHPAGHRCECRGGGSCWWLDRAPGGPPLGSIDVRDLARAGEGAVLRSPRDDEQSGSPVGDSLRRGSRRWSCWRWRRRCSRAPRLIGLPSVLLIYMLVVVVVAVIGGSLPAVGTAVVRSCSRTGTSRRPSTPGRSTSQTCSRW